MSVQAGGGWSDLLRLAASRFGVPPAEFWRLSLTEWLALTAPTPGAAPLDRADLESLLAAFPDDPSRTDP